MISIHNDGAISIAEGRSRREKVWKNKLMNWSELLEKLSKTTYTAETVEEYKNLSKNEQDDIKDVGGFVGGLLKNGRRKRDSVVNITVLTLDADFAEEGLWSLINKSFDFACCLYSTHKHVKDKPRLRLVIPLSRAVTPEEYEAVARKIAKDIGIEYFDDTTYEPSRLMYWPSTSRDGCFEFEFKDAKWLSPDEVKVTLGQERLKTVREDFYIAEDIEGFDMEWLKLLEVDKRGFYRPTITNILLILENDPYLKGKIALNEFSHMTMIRENLPWHKIKNAKDGGVYSDRDDAALRQYIEKVYEITSPNKISDALLIVEDKNKYHPIREYIMSLSWDGVSRVDKLLIDYLGAEDCPYVRTVTRKALAAAVARVFEPGIKFDYMLVLVGKQGLGKSHIVRLLGQSWFSDSLSTVQGKEAYEQLQNAWLIEMAELSATKKAEAEAVKHFISKCEDSYRVAYGKRVTKFPRQCVFFGTTNDNEFLKDKTGNRRFWPVVTGLCERKKNMWTDLLQPEIDQIWAEALAIWRAGEKLYLDSEAEKQALKVQENHTEESTKEGMISEYLDRLLPSCWSSMDIGARRRFIHGCEFGEAEEGTVLRDRVCAMEIWVELFQGEPKTMTPIQAREINDILRKLEGWRPYAKGTGKLKFGKIYGPQRAFVKADSEAA